MLVTAFLSDFETKVTGDLVMSPLLGPPSCSPNLLTQAPLPHQILNNPPPPPTHPHPHPSIMFSTLKGKPGDVHPRTYKVKMMYACVCTRPFSGNIQHQNSTCFQ